MITSITMTVFYLILYFIFEMRYDRKNSACRLTVVVLALIRIVLCLLPQNDWTGEAPMIGMLMLPKTCMYMWIVVMGSKMAKAQAGNAA